MTRVRPVRIVLAMVSFGMCCDVVFGWPAVQDPTTPSRQITERINNQAPGSPGALIVQPKLPLLRIRAMVFRDIDHGMALVSAEDQKAKFFVQLRRSNGKVKRQIVVIEGARFEVESFSETSIVLRNVGSNRTMTIN